MRGPAFVVSLSAFQRVGAGRARRMKSGAVDARQAAQLPERATVPSASQAAPRPSSPDP